MVKKENPNSCLGGNSSLKCGKGKLKTEALFL